MERFLSSSLARRASALMKWITVISMLFMSIGLILSFMGRETFSLRTPEGSWDSAIYSEESHDRTTRGITVTSDDDIYVVTRENDIPLSIQIAVSAMSAVTIIPEILAMYFLAKVFGSVSEGRIFTEENSKRLFLYGAITFVSALAGPFVKLGICALATSLSGARIGISTGSRIIEDLIPAIGFIIAAYIIRHGLSLQDEVDHTI